MAKMFRPRRGTTEKNAALVGGVGELTVDTTKGTVRVHDGTTAGGTELARTKDIPINTSQLTNDSGFLTAHQDLSAYAKTSDLSAYAKTSAIPTQTSQLTNNSGFITNTTTCFELKPGASAGHGGYIDFHYNNSTADYTSRIIEQASGTLSITGALTVAGALKGKTVQATSDRRMKANFTTPTYDLSTLKAYRYTFRGESVYHVGLIAQDVQKVIPEAVSVSGAEGYLALDYNAVVAALVNAVNDLQNQINQLKEAKNG